MAPINLPRFIVLKSKRNDKYLIHLRDDNDRLQFSGTEFESQHVKFEVEPSTKGSEFVHLKCCFNNRYWVVRPDQLWVSADAFEKEEDQSKPLCTLFKPVLFTSSNRIGFYHAYLKSNVMFDDTAPPFDMVVKRNETEILHQSDYLDFEDWENLPILPKFMALKGVDGNYLNTYSEKTRPEAPVVAGLMAFVPFGSLFLLNDGIRKELLGPGYVYLRFNCKDKAEQGVANQVFKNDDRTIRIKNLHTEGFWRRSPNWILPDSSDETSNNRDTLFEVVKLDHNRIALKNLGNNKYCESLSADGNDHCLNANTTTIPDTAQFEVEELVTSRQIYNVRFHDENARVYKKEILNVVKMSDNNNSSITQESTLDLDYEYVESTEWKLSTSTKLSIETQITFGPPNILQGNIKLGAEVTKEVSEGKTTSIKLNKKYGKKIYVPSKTKIVVNFRVTQAICDIPYSYSVREKLTNGLIVVDNDRDDGLYTSIQTDIDFTTNELPAE